MTPGVSAVLGQDGLTHWAFFDPFVLKWLLTMSEATHAGSAICRASYMQQTYGALVNCIVCVAVRGCIREAHV